MLSVYFRHRDTAFCCFACIFSFEASRHCCRRHDAISFFAPLFITPHFLSPFSLIFRHFERAALRYAMHYASITDGFGDAFRRFHFIFITSLLMTLRHY